MAGVDILATAFNGANAAYLADLYARWAADPGAVDPSFSDLFSALGEEARAVLGDAAGASWAPRPNGAADSGRTGTPPPPPRASRRCAPPPATACGR